MSSTLNKRVKEVSNIDRLSELPESIILHILSFLKVDESAITAVLSRKWQFLWTQSPELYFRQGNLKVPDFAARVNRTLVTRGPICLQHFVVEFEFTKPFASEVNAWVQFAVSNQVKRVGFLLNTLGKNNIISDFYVLPQLMCSNSILVSLGIKGCTIVSQRTIDWPSLTYLFIEGVEVQQQLIPKILSGCPVLSELTLNECWGFSSLDIKSETLVDIFIVDRDHEGINGPLLEISAPYIESLRVYLSDPERRKLRLTNIPSDAIVTIELNGPCVVDSVKAMNNAKEILGSIHHVEDVVLGANYVQVLSLMAIEYGYDQFPQSTSRTSLTVNTHRDELDDIHAILGLVKSSPNLRELIIEGQDYEKEPYNTTSANGDRLSDFVQLKTVIIKNFVAPNPAGEPMLTLAQILLKRAPNLEKIVIYVKAIVKSSPALDPFKILETVLGYPRSSQKASILLR